MELELTVTAGLGRGRAELTVTAGLGRGRARLLMLVLQLPSQGPGALGPGSCGWTGPGYVSPGLNVFATPTVTAWPWRSPPLLSQVPVPWQPG